MTNTLKAVEMAKIILEEKVKTASFLLDATAGNGFDTLFLAENSPAAAKIWAFDIQSEAIARARQLLTGAGFASKVEFVPNCHSQIKLYIASEIDAAMFNLGYLPNSGHNVKTLPLTTVAAIEQTLTLLNAGGLISVIAYPGHPGGEEEYQAVRNFLTNLPSKIFSVGCWQMLNQKNCPPVLFVVARK